MSRLPFHRPPGFLPHRPHERYCRAAHAGPQLTSRSNPGKSIPDGAQRFLVAHSCRASLARRRVAAQPVRREPSRRQTGKPAYSCLAESQKPKQTNGSSHFIRPWTPDFYGKATPLTVDDVGSSCRQTVAVGNGCQDHLTDRRIGIGSRFSQGDGVLGCFVKGASRFKSPTPIVDIDGLSCTDARHHAFMR